MKFFLTDVGKEALKSRREREFAGPDQQLYLHIGQFTTWFGACEMWITLLLCKATKITDTGSFDLLTRGMDATTKINRLRLASESFKPIGADLDARLGIFERHMVKLRNRIAHTLAALERETDIVSLTTLGRIPMRSQLAGKEDQITLLELYEHGVWLDLFRQDLKKVSLSLAQLETLEIDNPVSPLLPGSDQPDARKEKPTTHGKRDRKRQRKGQPPRANVKPQQ